MLKTIRIEVESANKSCTVAPLIIVVSMRDCISLLLCHDLATDTFADFI